MSNGTSVTSYYHKSAATHYMLFHCIHSFHHFCPRYNVAISLISCFTSQLVEWDVTWFVCTASANIILKMKMKNTLYSCVRMGTGMLRWCMEKLLILFCTFWAHMHVDLLSTQFLWFLSNLDTILQTILTTYLAFCSSHNRLILPSRSCDVLLSKLSSTALENFSQINYSWLQKSFVRR